VVGASVYPRRHVARRHIARRHIAAGNRHLTLIADGNRHVTSIGQRKKTREHRQNKANAT
jgi:hypothetical protein